MIIFPSQPSYLCQFAIYNLFAFSYSYYIKYSDNYIEIEAPYHMVTHLQYNYLMKYIKGQSR